MNTQYTSKELSEALRVFIKSGSANGNEPMRKKCLKLIPTFAIAPELLEALKRVTFQLQHDDNDEAWREARATISKAEKGE